MNMENYDKDIWILHRKLFHRYLKYYKYFKQATGELPEFKQLLVDEKDEAAEVLEKKVKSQPVTKTNIISLLSSSSDDVSPEEDNGDSDNGYEGSPEEDNGDSSSKHDTSPEEDNEDNDSEYESSTEKEIDELF